MTDGDRADALLATLAQGRAASSSLEDTVAAAKRAGARAHLALQGAVARLDAQLDRARRSVDSIAAGFGTSSSEEEEEEEYEDGGADGSGGGGESKVPPAPAPPLQSSSSSSSSFSSSPPAALPSLAMAPDDTNAPPPTLAIAMLIRDPPTPSLHGFLRYHRLLGFSRVYLFFDDVDGDFTERDHAVMRAAAAYTGFVVTVHCTRGWYQELQHGVATATTWARYCEFISSDLIARQVLAVEQAVQMACDDGLDWILHIDIDELLHWPTLDTTAAGIAADIAPRWFARIPEHVDAVRFLNLEAAPESVELGDGDDGGIGDDLDCDVLLEAGPRRPGTGDCFREISLFKVNPSSLGSRFHSLMRRNWPKGRAYFTAYKNGKTAVRCQRDVIPKGSHGFERTDPKRLLVAVDASQLVAGQQDLPPQVLHFPHASFTLWQRKYKILGQFPDLWCGAQKIPRESFHIQSRDAVMCATTAAAGGGARAFFMSTMVFQDEELKAQLIASGLLVRYKDVAECISRLFG